MRVPADVRFRLPFALLLALGAPFLGTQAARADGGARVGVAVQAPAGFTPAPTALARRAAQPLLELLEGAGLKPLGVLRARQELLGAPREPAATLLTAQVRVLTASAAARPALDASALASALADLVAREDGALVVGPQPRQAAGLAGTEIGFTLPQEGGRARLRRILLLPVSGAVLCVDLDVRDGDEKQWSATWARLMRTARPQRLPRESSLPLVPALPLALAAAALLAAGAQRLRRPPAPERPSEAFVAQLEGRGRAPRALARPTVASPAAPSALALACYVAEATPREQPASAPPSPSPAPAPAPAAAPQPDAAAAMPSPSGTDGGAALLDLVRVDQAGGGSFGAGPSLLELKLARRQQTPP